MPNTIIGRVSIRPRGDWSSSTAYERLDAVAYQGESFLALANSTNQAPPNNPTYWMKLAQKGDNAPRDRVASLNTLELSDSNIIETVGVPAYVTTAQISTYSAYGITEEGWYVFARISAVQGVTVGTGFAVTGAAGFITPAAGADHVDVAVKFGTAAASQKVTVTWATGTSEVFVFKSTDLAVQNLDYRVTYYVYDISPYATWTYALTSDSTFVAGRPYYTKNGNVYTKATVTTGAAVPANTYYNQASLVLSGFSRNISYYTGVIDCPVTIKLPAVSENGYGAWVEIQFAFRAVKSVTINPGTGATISTTGVNATKVGVNVFNAQYYANQHVWGVTNTVWQMASVS